MHQLMQARLALSTCCRGVQEKEQQDGVASVEGTSDSHSQEPAREATADGSCCSKQEADRQLQAQASSRRLTHNFELHDMSQGAWPDHAHSVNSAACQQTMHATA